jgi:hypothetical protein
MSRVGGALAGRRSGDEPLDTGEMTATGGKRAPAAAFCAVGKRQIAADEMNILAGYGS